MFKCEFCGAEFKNQGGLNLHKVRGKCRKESNLSKKECEHTSSRILTKSELDYTSESGQRVGDMGFHSVCLKCGELIGGNNDGNS